MAKMKKKIDNLENKFITKKALEEVTEKLESVLEGSDINEIKTKLSSFKK